MLHIRGTFHLGNTTPNRRVGYSCKGQSPYIPKPTILHPHRFRKSFTKIGKGVRGGKLSDRHLGLIRSSDHKGVLPSLNPNNFSYFFTPNNILVLHLIIEFSVLVPPKNNVLITMELMRRSI